MRASEVDTQFPIRPFPEEVTWTRQNPISGASSLHAVEESGDDSPAHLGYEVLCLWLFRLVNTPKRVTPLSRFVAALQVSLPVSVPNQQTIWPIGCSLPSCRFARLQGIPLHRGPLPTEIGPCLLCRFPFKALRRTGIRPGYPVSVPSCRWPKPRLQGFPPPVKRCSRRNTCLPGRWLPRGFASSESFSGFPESPSLTLGCR